MDLGYNQFRLDCLTQVTANNGGFLIELVYNNLPAGFLDEHNHLYYPAMLC